MKKMALAVVLCSVLLFSQHVSALIIQPGDAVTSGNETSQETIAGLVQDYIRAQLGLASDAPVEQLYKQDQGGGEYGAYADWYNTTFDNTPTDPMEATITWQGLATSDPYVTSPVYLLVKDGNQDPAWYLFDLSTSWDGMETLSLQNFWPNQGAISNVSLWGTQNPIPEPATMALFGTGLAGLVAVARKRKQK